jgi:hypothetical protein
MKKEDEPNTSFITPSVTYCYLRIPEGLKNAGGSFNIMTAKVLHSQIGTNVLTYVDDIIVKSTKQENHIADLQEMFANFRSGVFCYCIECNVWNAWMVMNEVVGGIYSPQPLP